MDSPSRELISTATATKPIASCGFSAGHFWPRRGFLKKPGTIQLVIGPVIESRGRSAEEINRLAEAWVNETMARLES